MTTTTYQVTGMTCEHCVQAVTSELGKLAGVADVAVGLVPDGVSNVTVSSDGPLASSTVSEALGAARRLPHRGRLTIRHGAATGAGTRVAHLGSPRSRSPSVS